MFWFSVLCFCRFLILGFQSTVALGFYFYADGYCVVISDGLEYQPITPLCTYFVALDKWLISFENSGESKWKLLCICKKKIIFNCTAERHIWTFLLRADLVVLLPLGLTLKMKLQLQTLIPFQQPSSLCFRWDHPFACCVLARPLHSE